MNNGIGKSDAAKKLEDWRRHDKDDRPHNAIGCNIQSALNFPDDIISLPP